MGRAENNSLEQTFILIKPDGVQKRLSGLIISIFERKEFNLKKLKMTRVDREFAKRHYAEHKGKKYFEDIIKHISSGDVVAMVLEGRNSIGKVRKLIDEIRLDFGTNSIKNVIHGSDSIKSARREIDLWFVDQ
ncbi:Nucleoside diphosphate kinase 1 [Bonamia ostreae]|uniref:Nucleoside diphosphate kinase n=1 Tax=Bonamia ostreae TaxID=126728 RepID=A0ABV2AN95_9EUKA